MLLDLRGRALPCKNVRYGAVTTKFAKSHATDSLAAIAEAPSLPQADRQALRESLDRACTDIAAGDFDIVTPGTLQAQFDGIFRGDEKDEALDARLSAQRASTR